MMTASPGRKHMRAVSVDLASSADEHNRNSQQQSKGTRRVRAYASKYDLVKVRVWLEDHYYVLSRFLVSRMLTVTKVALEDAIKASLELKKRLVDQHKLDVQQDVMEKLLFSLIRQFGYKDIHLERYRMITRFHHQRVPLIVLISGTGCIGKSILATQLAERLNLPSVLQTDLVHEMMAALSTDLTGIPIWGRPFISAEQTVADWKRECAIIRKGLEGDIRKAFEDGKPIIIEGIHLDLSLYDDVLETALKPPVNPASDKQSKQVNRSKRLNNVSIMPLLYHSS